MYGVVRNCYTEKFFEVWNYFVLCRGRNSPFPLRSSFRCARLSDALSSRQLTLFLPIKLNSIPSAQAEYDHEFVKELKTFIYQMISRSNRGVTLNALTKLIITDNKITHVELTKREVLMVVDTAQGGWGMGRLVRVQRGGERG